MGHYASEDEQNLQNGDTTVFDHFKRHCSAKAVNYDLIVLESIRASHPDKHVTAISKGSCDLLGFAKAGHATANLVTHRNDFVAQRTYHAPVGRLESEDGKLGESVSFGQYNYTADGQQYLLYSVEWADPMCGRAKKYYILSPKEDVDDQAHSKSADRLITACGKWTTQLQDAIYVFDAGRWQKNHELCSAVQSASWDDVILDPAMKDTLINDVQSFFDSRQVYEDYSVPWKRGIIFHGVPGCGKTISIKALMHSLQSMDVASLYVKSFEPGQGAQQSIRAIFTQARVMAPCLLIFEDIDSLVKDDIRSYFLNEVDGLESNDGILMIGSTNHLAKLDPAISKRPSRFDRKYHYSLPGERERFLYSMYWSKKLQSNSNLELSDDVCQVIAQLTEGFSFAYMKELMVQCLLAIVGGRADTEDDLDEAAVTAAAETTKVIEGSARLGQEGETTEATTVGEPSEHKTGDTTTGPLEVEVPQHLKNHQLLRILRKQIVALRKDMDNSDDAAAKPKIP